MIWQGNSINAIIFPSWLDSTAFTIGPISIEWYGIAYVIGLVLAYLYAARIAENKRYWIPSGPIGDSQIVPTRDDLGNLMFYAFIGILAGGRFGYVLLYDTDMIWTEPLQIVLGIRGGGMSFHGGFLGVCAAVGYAAWRKKTSWPERRAGYMRFADLACIGAPIGIGLVRITNFINQELYGHHTDLPWGVIFPLAPDSLPRHPSQLYEAFLEGLILWLILRLLTTRFRAMSKPGLITAAFVMGYGVFRFMVEFVRTPDPIPQFGMLTRGMAYSLPMVAVGLLVIIWAIGREAVTPQYAADADSKTEAAAKNG